MTKNTMRAPAAAVLTYEAAIEVQDLMVRRGLLAGRAHDVANGVEDEDGFVLLEQDADGDVLIVCTCGRAMLLPAVEASRSYALHVASALGVSLGLAA